MCPHAYLQHFCLKLRDECPGSTCWAFAYHESSIVYIYIRMYVCMFLLVSVCHLGNAKVWAAMQRDPCGRVDLREPYACQPVPITVYSLVLLFHTSQNPNTNSWWFPIHWQIECVNFKESSPEKAEGNRKNWCETTAIPRPGHDLRVLLTSASIDLLVPIGKGRIWTVIFMYDNVNLVGIYMYLSLYTEQWCLYSFGICWILIWKENI